MLKVELFSSFTRCVLLIMRRYLIYK